MSNQLVNQSAVKTISEFADVHFIFPNDDKSEKLPAHRNILSSVSPVFAAMLYGPLKEGDVVKIDDSNAIAFKEFLQFIYLPEITLTMENIEEVVRLADKYDILDRLDTCASFLKRKITIESVTLIYELSLLLKNEKLMEFCEKYIKLFTNAVLETDAFLKCGQEVIRRILESDILACSEYELFDACMKWAEKSCQSNGLDEKNSVNLKTQLGPCFHLIRFGTMNTEVVDFILSNEIYKNMFAVNELLDIFRTKFSKSYEPEIFNHAKRSTAVMSSLTELACQRESLDKSGILRYMKEQE